MLCWARWACCVPHASMCSPDRPGVHEPWVLAGLRVTWFFKGLGLINRVSGGHKECFACRAGHAALCRHDSAAN